MKQFFFALTIALLLLASPCSIAQDKDEFQIRIVPRGQPEWDWTALANHSGLGMLSPKKKDEFVLETRADWQRLNEARATIRLTADDLKILLDSSLPHLFSDWDTNAISGRQWKSTVNLILNDTKIDVSELGLEDLSIALENKVSSQLRVYILKPNKDESGGTLYYFYRSPFSEE